jgi:hypothetical protein
VEAVKDVSPTKGMLQVVVVLAPNSNPQPFCQTVVSLLVVV